MRGEQTTDLHYNQTSINEFLAMDDDRALQYQKKQESIEAAYKDVQTYINHYGLEYI